MDNGMNEMTPPDDMVTTVDLGGGLMLTDFRHHFRKNPPEVRELIPDDSLFWATPAYLCYSASLPTTIIAGTEDQATELEAINVALEGIGLQRIAVWSPSTASEYVGDLQMTPAQTARLIAKVHLLASTARALGRQDITERQQHLETLAPTMAASLLSIMLAREVVGKNLMACDQSELAQVHEATGQLLRATAVAVGKPMAQANLPKLPAAPAPEPDQGQGQWPGYL